MRVVITNTVLTNSGDAAICQGVIRALVTAGVCKPSDVTVLDNNAKVSSALYPEHAVFQQPLMPAVSGSRVRRAVSRGIRAGHSAVVGVAPKVASRLYRRLAPARSGGLRALLDADLVISSGGTYLVDHYDFRQRVRELVLAHRAGARIVLWTQSMGPFVSARAKKNMARLGSVVDRVYFRDARSQRSWEALFGGRSPARLACVPDAAFALYDPSQTQDDIAGDEVVVSVRRWSRAVEGGEMDGQLYETSMRSLVSHLDASYGVRPVARSTCQGVKGYIDDSEYASEIFAGAPINIDREHHTPEQLLAQFHRARCVVATRMHMAILALIARRPVVAIAYEFKTTELFEGLGLGTVRNIEDIDPQWLRDRVDEVLGGRVTATLDKAALSALSYEAMRPARDILADARSGGV